MGSIFVSSTFRDMQEERDIIYRIVAPAITKEARTYGDSISFCDLRWGVDTSELDPLESSKKVMKVCFDEIDRARPYMIVLLGDRYGWIPGEETVEELKLSEKLAGLEIQGKSVTELEIRYGALKDKETREHTLFYFREFVGDIPEGFGCTSEEEKEKLGALKAEIREKCRKQVRTYSWDVRNPATSGEQFAKQLEEDLQALLQADRERPKNELEQEMKLHYGLLNEAKRLKTSRPAVLQEIHRLETEIDNPPIMLRGEEGDSLNDILAELAEEAEKGGAIVIPVFCGRSDRSAKCLDVLKLLVNEVETRGKLPKYQDYLKRNRLKSAMQAAKNHMRLQAQKTDITLETQEWKTRLSGDLYLLSKRKKHVLLLMADLEKLSDTLTAQTMLFLPEELPDGAKLFISFNEFTSRLNPVAKEYHVPKIGKTEAEDILNEMLKDQGKELDAAVRKAILKKKSISSALYLKLLFRRLQMMDRAEFEQIRKMGDGMENISAYQRSVIRSCPEGLSALTKQLILETIKRLENTSEGCLPRCLAYLAQTRTGLRVSDLRELLEAEGKLFDQIAFSQFLCSFNDFLHSDDAGKFRFSYDFLKEMFFEQGAYRTLAAYEETLPKEDAVRRIDLPLQFLNYGTPEEVFCILERIHLEETWSLHHLLENREERTKRKITEHIREALKFYQKSHPELSDWKEEMTKRLESMRDEGRQYIHIKNGGGIPDYEKLNRLLDHMEELSHEYLLMAEDEERLGVIFIYDAVLKLAEEIYEEDSGTTNLEALSSAYNSQIDMLVQERNCFNEEMIRNLEKKHVFRKILHLRRNIDTRTEADEKMRIWIKRKVELDLKRLELAERSKKRTELSSARENACNTLKNYFSIMSMPEDQKDIPAEYREAYIDLKKKLKR